MQPANGRSPSTATSRPVLLGANQGPNAVEAVLHALASCLADGQLDLHGFLGLSMDVRPGYGEIRVTYRIDCDATAQKVDELFAYLHALPPVLDIINNPVPVTIIRS